MPKNNESIQRELFSLLQSRDYDPSILDSSGKEIAVPEDGEVFQFKFIKDGVDYGTVTITIDGLHKLIVYYSDKIANSPKLDNDEESEDTSWYHLLGHLRKFAKRNQLSFELKNLSKLKHDMAKRADTKKKELAEGYYPKNKMESESDNIPKVKILLKHRRKMEEGEARFRQIDKIFVENVEGERFLLPTRKLSEARAYARHIAEGGYPNDERGKHIQSLCEERSKTSGYLRATRNHTFEGQLLQLREAAVAHYESLGSTIHQLSTQRGYNKFFESWKPTLNEVENDYSSLQEQFMENKLDDRIAEALPILSRLSESLPKQEQIMDEAIELAEWADELIEGSLKTKNKVKATELIDLLDSNSSEMIVGPDASNAKSILDDLLISSDLFRELEELADDNPDADARDTIIDWISDNRHSDPSIMAVHDAIFDATHPKGKESSEPQKPAPKAPPTDSQKTMPSKGATAEPQLPPLEESEFDRILKLSGLQ